jgi:hypothetical protein
MNIHPIPKSSVALSDTSKVDNVSRRSILKGLGLAGGFVWPPP